MMLTLNYKREFRITQQPFHAVGRKGRTIRITSDAAVHVVLKVNQDSHLDRSTGRAGNVL